MATKEIWPDQELESDLLALAEDMGFVNLERGRGEVQRDVILNNRIWHDHNMKWVPRILAVAMFIGPTASRIIETRCWRLFVASAFGRLFS